MLGSCAWGTLQQKNILIKTADQINEKDMDVGKSDEHQYIISGMFEKNGEDYYKLVNTKCAYRYRLRLKPWITAQARDDLGRLIVKNLKSVVRVQTDSVSFSKKN
jgi:hypothetical protein